MSSGDNNSQKSGDWSYLGREIKRRTREPFEGFPFVIYVILAIIGLGCLGIWVELIKVALSPAASNYAGVFTALATFFPALIGSSSLQLILASTAKGDKVLVAFGYFVNMAAFAGALLLSVFHNAFPSVSFWAAVGFAASAIWLWCFTNGDDPTFRSAPVDAPSGGDTNKALKGDTSGFRE